MNKINATIMSVIWIAVLILSLCLGSFVKAGEPVVFAEEQSPSVLIDGRTEEEKIGTIDFSSRLPNITDLYVDNQADGEYVNTIDNFNNMYHMEIVKTEDTDYPYQALFFGWGTADTNPGWQGCDAIFMARGKNLDTWEFYAGKNKVGAPTYTDQMNPAVWVPVVTADPTKWYDNWHNGDPSLVYKDGVFYLAYSAYGTDLDMQLGGDDGDISCIMGATSTDFIHWKKSEAPLLIWEEEIGKNEPVTGNPQKPYPFTTNQFFGLYHRPSWIYDEEEGIWKMWFDYISRWDSASGGNNMSMGYAENRGDPMNPDDWTVIQKDDQPAITEFANPCVKKINGVYYAYADPNATLHGAENDRLSSGPWTMRQLVEAQSSDGINWTVTGFIVPDEDCQACHVPTLYYEDGILYLFYASQKGNRADPLFDRLGNRYYNGDTYDYRYFAIRYKARFLDYQISKNVTY